MASTPKLSKLLAKLHHRTSGNTLPILRARATHEIGYARLGKLPGTRSRWRVVERGQHCGGIRDREELHETGEAEVARGDSLHGLQGLTRAPRVAGGVREQGEQIVDSARRRGVQSAAQVTNDVEIGIVLDAALYQSLLQLKLFSLVYHSQFSQRHSRHPRDLHKDRFHCFFRVTGHHYAGPRRHRADEELKRTPQRILGAFFCARHLRPAGK